MDYTGHVSIRALVTVVETPEILARIDKLMTEGEREELIAYLAANPTAGDLIPGTGGVRRPSPLSRIDPPSLSRNYPPRFAARGLSMSGCSGSVPAVSVVGGSRLTFA
jgi:hypothetical protein